MVGAHTQRAYRRELCWSLPEGPPVEWGMGLLCCWLLAQAGWVPELPWGDLVERDHMALPPSQPLDLSPPQLSRELDLTLALHLRT